MQWVVDALSSCDSPCAPALLRLRFFQRHTCIMGLANFALRLFDAALKISGFISVVATLQVAINDLTHQDDLFLLLCNRSAYNLTYGNDALLALPVEHLDYRYSITFFWINAVVSILISTLLVIAPGHVAKFAIMQSAYSSREVSRLAKQSACSCLKRAFTRSPAEISPESSSRDGRPPAANAAPAPAREESPLDRSLASSAHDSADTHARTIASQLGIEASTMQQRPAPLYLHTPMQHRIHAFYYMIGRSSPFRLFLGLTWLASYVLAVDVIYMLVTPTTECFDDRFITFSIDIILLDIEVLVFIILVCSGVRRCCCLPCGPECFGLCLLRLRDAEAQDAATVLRMESDRSNLLEQISMGDLHHSAAFPPDGGSQANYEPPQPATTAAQINGTPQLTVPNDVARGLTDAVAKGTPNERQHVAGSSSPAQPLNSPKKRALVVGINKYAVNEQPCAPLRCCVNDATALHAALMRMGFASQLHVECSAETLRWVTRDFVQSLQHGDIALFFFAGHGVEAATYQGGRQRTSNWLLSNQVPPNGNAELPLYAIDAHSLLAEMENRQTSFNALVLDCCRDDPLQRDTRSIGGGLASMEANGSIVAFSCAPGQRAAEGPGAQHGVYTKHLLEHIETPGLDVNKLFIRVRKAVINETSCPPYLAPQVPWNNDALTIEDASLLPVSADET